MTTLRQRCARFYDALPVGIAVLAATDDRLVYANPAYGRVLEIPDDQPLAESAVHRAFIGFYRRIRSLPSHTLRLLPEEDDGEIRLLDLFNTALSLPGAPPLRCLTLVPIAQRDRLIQAKERQDLIFDRLRIYAEWRVVKYGKTIVEFSGTEFRLFHFLARHPERLFSKHELLEAVWQRRAQHTRTVDMCVSRVRGRLRAAGCHVDYIRTRHGQGYLFALPT